ncbi:MAG: hypothetical protein EA380_06390 [Phycisphaeraceae bacterium]|nr:MAG: hypothetical protein EA380_06390 [Phycisphaeraceae bacterium]
MIVLPQITPNLALQHAQRPSAEPKASFAAPFAKAVNHATPAPPDAKTRNDAAQSLRKEHEPALEDADRPSSEEQADAETSREDSDTGSSAVVGADTPRTRSEADSQSDKPTKDESAQRPVPQQQRQTSDSASKEGASDAVEKTQPERSQKVQTQSGPSRSADSSAGQQAQVARPTTAESEPQSLRTSGDHRTPAEHARAMQAGSTSDQHPPDDSASQDDSKARARTLLRAESTSAEVAKPTGAFDAALQSSRVRPGAPGHDPGSQPPPTPLTMRADSGAESPARDAAFAAGVSRGLAAVLNQKGGTLTMLLNPASLGSLRIAMSIDAGSVSVTMEAVRPEAQEMLNRNLQSLRAVLEARGLTVERIGVQLAPQSQNTDNSQSQQHNARNDDARSFGDRANAGGGESRGKREQTPQTSDADPEFNDEITDSTTRFERIRLALETVA